MFLVGFIIRINKFLRQIFPGVIDFGFLRPANMFVLVV